MKTFTLESDEKIMEAIIEIRYTLMRSFEPVTSPYFVVLLNGPQTSALVESKLFYPELGSINGPWRFAGADVYPFWNWPKPDLPAITEAFVNQ